MVAVVQDRRVQVESTEVVESQPIDLGNGPSVTAPVKDDAYQIVAGVFNACFNRKGHKDEGSNPLGNLVRATQHALSDVKEGGAVSAFEGLSPKLAEDTRVYLSDLAASSGGLTPELKERGGALAAKIEKMIDSAPSSVSISDKNALKEITDVALGLTGEGREEEGRTLAQVLNHTSSVVGSQVDGSVSRTRAILQTGAARACSKAAQLCGLPVGPVVKLGTTLAIRNQRNRVKINDDARQEAESSGAMLTEEVYGGKENLASGVPRSLEAASKALVQGDQTEAKRNLLKLAVDLQAVADKPMNLAASVSFNQALGGFSQVANEAGIVKGEVTASNLQTVIDGLAKDLGVSSAQVQAVSTERQKRIAALQESLVPAVKASPQRSAQTDNPDLLNMGERVLKFAERAGRVAKKAFNLGERLTESFV